MTGASSPENSNRDPVRIAALVLDGRLAADDSGRGQLGLLDEAAAAELEQPLVRVFGEVELGKGLGRVAIASAANPDRDGTNHDALSISSVEAAGDEGPVVVLAVADGAGGQARPMDASRLVIQELNQAIEANVRRGAGVRGGVINGFEAANEKVLELKAGAASTLSVVAIEPARSGPGLMRCFHVGDSTVAVTGQRGRVKFRSMSHSPVGYGVAAGLLATWEALVHEERHLVDNLVGMSTMRIDVGPRVQLASRDRVLVASDGLWDNLRPLEVIRAVCAGDLEESVRSVLDLAMRRMKSEGKLCKPDDVTIVLWGS
jgi:serine/threonine protein phosphatase PrpC